MGQTILEPTLIVLGFKKNIKSIKKSVYLNFKPIPLDVG